MKKSLTLVIAVYNGVRNLEFILTALQRQTLQDFEVVIADDGSGPAIKELIDLMKPSLSFPVNHLWHEDIGFRKNVMLNKAINASQTDYLVFIDGDCVPHHKFINDHWMSRQTNTVLCGRRVNFSKQITERLTLEGIKSGTYEKLSLSVLLDGLLARSANLEDGIRIENNFLRRLLHRNQARILGCNFSVEKKMLEQINGFNEDYQAPGRGEDSDIAFRLGLIGAKFVPLRYYGVLYHMYHRPTVGSEENKKIYEKIVRDRNPICSNGLRKLDLAESTHGAVPVLH